MFRNMLFAGLAVAAFVPSLAQAQSEGQARCQQQRHENSVVGTILGAGLGALLGNAIGEHGGKAGGTIIGGIGGAVAGNAIGGASVNCGSNRYGYYDDNGRWVPNTATSYGYYDFNGRWIDTTSQGYAPPVGAGGPDDAYEQPDARQPGSYDREDRLEARIQERLSDGALDEWRGRHALRQLRDIRRMDADYRAYDGNLTEDQRRDIRARLDAVRADIGDERGGDDRGPAGPPRPY